MSVAIPVQFPYPRDRRPGVLKRQLDQKDHYCPLTSTSPPRRLSSDETNVSNENGEANENTVHLDQLEGKNGHVVIETKRDQSQLRAARNHLRRPPRCVYIGERIPDESFALEDVETKDGHCLDSDGHSYSTTERKAQDDGRMTVTRPARLRMNNWPRISQSVLIGRAIEKPDV